MALSGTVYDLFLGASIIIFGLPSLLTHILHAASYLLASKDIVGVVYSGYYIAFVLLFAFLRWEYSYTGSSYTSRDLLSSLPWRTIAVCFATTPFIFFMGGAVLTSLPAAVYFFAGIVIWSRFMKQPSGRLALLSGAMFALSSWTRTEAFYFCFVALAITSVRGIVNAGVREHLTVMILPVSVMDLSQYAILALGGQFEAFSHRAILPYVDLIILAGLVGYSILVTRVDQQTRDRLRMAILGTIVLGLAGLGVTLLLSFEGLGVSAARLWHLLRDPTWGLTGTLFVVALFSPSLFKRNNRLLFIVFMSLLVVRIFIYSRILDWGQADTAFDDDGNRILLYIWPLAFYWLSGSRELRLVGATLLQRRRPLRKENRAGNPHAAEM